MSEEDSEPERLKALVAKLERERDIKESVARALAELAGLGDAEGIETLAAFAESHVARLPRRDDAPSRKPEEQN